MIKTEVTEAMNQVIDQRHEPPDPFVATAARRILERTEWSPCRRERSGGQICPSPPAPAPGFRRPVVIVQGDPLNRSPMATVVCVPLTSQLTWARPPGHVLLSAKAAGLPKDSVTNASQIIAVDRAFLTERVAKLPPRHFAQVMSGIDVVLGR
jgi:mRNA interferase MazF